MKLSPLERILLGLTAAFVLGTALIFCFGNQSTSVVIVADPSSSADTIAAMQKTDTLIQEQAASAALSQTPEPSQAAMESEPSPSVSPSPDVMEEGEKVNINTATMEQLKTLPGIGEKRAEAIVAYREEHGPFSKIEDIVKVSGIGKGIFSKMKPYLTVE